jgi:uncharacterized membrane protein
MFCESLDMFSLAQSMPTFDGQYFLLLTSRLLHILGAIILLGGVFYLWSVVAPGLQASGGAAGDGWFSGNRGTWAKWVGITSLALLATGLFNFVWNVKTYQLPVSYHMLVTLKIVLALVVFFLASVLAGRSGLAERLRTNMKFWLSICVLTGILVVFIGSFMRSYPRIEKPVSGPTLVAPSN